MIIKPGLFSVNAPQDVMRKTFDFFNSQIIAKGKHPDFLFIGDSIIQNWDTALCFAGNGYIVNRGVGSDFTGDMLRRWDADVIQLKPKQVIFLSGANDIGFAAETYIVPLEGARSSEENNKWYLGNMESIIGKTLDAGIPIAVCSILPFVIKAPRNNQYWNETAVFLNSQLKLLCQKYNIPYVDFYSKLVMSDKLEFDCQYHEDGIHPNAEGYAVMKQVLIDSNIGIRG